jgi:hypothetical protein
MEKKHIMTIEELVNYNNQVRKATITLGQMETRIIENAIEIATGYLSKMQDVCELGRDVLNTQFISVWAREFEMEWIKAWSEKDGDLSYYDAIDSFAEKKFQEFKRDHGVYDEPPAKKAMLVQFLLTARVAVTDKQPSDMEQDEAIELAINKIKNHLDDYLIADNLDGCYDDVDAPYDPETDLNINE